MTFVAEFGALMTVTCRLLASKSGVPLSRTALETRSTIRASFGTGFSASAPATQSGMEYVAGQRGGARAIWLCPVGQASAECRRVEVND